MNGNLQLKINLVLDKKTKFWHLNKLYEKKLIQGVPKCENLNPNIIFKITVYKPERAFEYY